MTSGWWPAKYTKEKNLAVLGFRRDILGNENVGEGAGTFHKPKTKNLHTTNRG